MTKITHSDDNFILFYRSDLYRNTFRYKGINVYFSDVHFIPSCGMNSPDFYQFLGLNGAESAKIAINKLPEELRTKLDKIVDGGSSE